LQATGEERADRERHKVLVGAGAAEDSGDRRAVELSFQQPAAKPSPKDV